MTVEPHSAEGNASVCICSLHNYLTCILIQLVMIHMHYGEQWQSCRGWYFAETLEKIT